MKFLLLLFAIFSNITAQESITKIVQELSDSIVQLENRSDTVNTPTALLRGNEIETLNFPAISQDGVKVAYRSSDVVCCADQGDDFTISNTGNPEQSKSWEKDLI